MNRVFLLGHLGSDPEVFGSVLKFRMATSERWNDKATGEKREKTEWHSVVVFGENRIAALQRILRKGQQVHVEGAIATSSYEKEGQKHYRTEIIASNVTLCGGRGESSEQTAPPPARQAAPEAKRAPQRAPAPSSYGDPEDPPF